MTEKKNNVTESRNRRKLGAEKEQLAAAYLESQGYTILERNFYSRFGEVDLIAGEGDTLVFCEVKYRKDTRMGHPAEAVSSQKLYRMQKTAEYYCSRCRIPADRPKRFDVVGILGEKITLYRNVTGS